MYYLIDIYAPQMKMHCHLVWLETSAPHTSSKKTPPDITHYTEGITLNHFSIFSQPSSPRKFWQVSLLMLGWRIHRPLQYYGVCRPTQSNYYFRKYEDKKLNNCNKKCNNLIANNAHINLKKKKKIFVLKSYASMVCPFETKYFILTSLHFNFPYNMGWVNVV